MYRQLRKPSIDLPIFLDSIGKGWEQPNTDRPKGFPFCHFLMGSKGTGVIEIDDQQFMLEEGTSFFINKNIPHKYYKVSQTWTTAFFTFDAKHTNSLLKDFNLDKFIFINTQETTKINFELERLISLTEETTLHSDLLSSAVLFNILTILATATQKNHFSNALATSVTVPHPGK